MDKSPVEQRTTPVDELAAMLTEAVGAAARGVDRDAAFLLALQFIAELEPAGAGALDGFAGRGDSSQEDGGDLKRTHGDDCKRSLCVLS